MWSWRADTLPATLNLTAEDEDGQTIEIATPAQVAYLLERRYGSMRYHCYPQFETVDSCAEEFLVDWMYESNIFAAMIQKWYDVMNQEYDPLANYDRDEKAKSWIGSRTVTRTHNNDKITVSGGKHEITYDDATYESAVKQREKVTDDRTAASYTDHTGGYTDTEAQTEENATHNDVRIKGNIGVTTSQQMAESELTLRQFNILVDFLAMFLRHHCYSAEGSCDR